MKLLKNRTVLGILCIVLSLAICFLVTPLFNQAILQKTEIVRVQKSIKAGDEITKDNVQMVEVGGYNLPGDVMKECCRRLCHSRSFARRLCSSFQDFRTATRRRHLPVSAGWK